jgi:hypothetical protein
VVGYNFNGLGGPMMTRLRRMSCWSREKWQGGGKGPWTVSRDILPGEALEVTCNGFIMISWVVRVQVLFFFKFLVDESFSHGTRQGGLGERERESR